MTTNIPKASDSRSLQFHQVINIVLTIAISGAATFFYSVNNSIITLSNKLDSFSTNLERLSTSVEKMNDKVANRIDKLEDRIRIEEMKK
jgi:cell division protein FtsL